MDRTLIPPGWLPSLVVALGISLIALCGCALADDTVASSTVRTDPSEVRAHVTGIRFVEVDGRPLPNDWISVADSGDIVVEGYVCDFTEIREDGDKPAHAMVLSLPQRVGQSYVFHCLQVTVSSEALVETVEDLEPLQGTPFQLRLAMYGDRLTLLSIRRTDPSDTSDVLASSGTDLPCASFDQAANSRSSDPVSQPDDTAWVALKSTTSGLSGSVSGLLPHVTEERVDGTGFSRADIEIPDSIGRCRLKHVLCIFSSGTAEGLAARLVTKEGFPPEASVQFTEVKNRFTVNPR